MAVNKVVMNTANGEQTLIDLTGDSVTPRTLAQGYTAHDASGAIITGTATEVSIVQGTGDSETDVMSQKAVTDALNGISITEADKADIAAMVIESLGGQPVFGYVDEDNTIVLGGNLADGTYTVKYEMENGTVVNIGNLVLDSNVYYSITSTLTNCTNSNSATKIVEGGSYAATITAKDGYELKSVSVTMGGSPVSVSGGNISIANVTGDIVITAVAEEKTVAIINLATPDASASGDAAWNSGGWCNNSYMAGSSYAYRAATDGRITTNTIAVEHGDIIYVKGIKYNAGTFPQIAVFDSNKSYVKHGYASNMNVGGQGLIILTATENSDTWYFTNSGQGGANVGTRFIRIAGYPSGNISDIIITRNQPIS